jgi:hypothetical protein
MREVDQEWFHSSPTSTDRLHRPDHMSTPLRCELVHSIWRHVLQVFYTSTKPLFALLELL